MIKKLINGIILFIIGISLGGICGYVIASMIKNFMSEQTKSTGTFLIIYGIILFSFAFSFMFHIIIHEAGHLVAGKLSGYSFVSFRIFNLTFIKNNGKLVLKKFKIAGTGGQCLMSPPELVNDRFPYVLYNMGGALMNFITSGVCIILYLCFPKTWEIGSIITVLLAMSGVFLGITNIVPLKAGGISNDGYNILMLNKNKDARNALWLQLRINALVTTGHRYRDMPSKWFDLIENADFNNPLLLSNMLFRYNYLFDQHNFKEGKELLEYLINKADKMLPIFKNELLCELLFLELIGECREDEINRLYNKNLQQYVKVTSIYISRQRLLYAYAKLWLKDDKKAIEVRERFNKFCDTCPNLGEIDAEVETILIIDEIANSYKIK